MQHWSITRGVVVLRLQGSEPSCSEAGSNCVVTLPNRELSEPFGRSGTLVHISILVRMKFPNIQLRAAARVTYTEFVVGLQTVKRGTSSKVSVG
jgi:hypothetical protein